MTPAAGRWPAAPNAITVDVEDYFHVSGFERHVSRASWEGRPSRVWDNTHRLLDLFEAHGVRATFFILGWVADRFPALVRRIAEAGHEIGSHGYEHRLVYDLTPAAFRDDLRKARAAIQGACHAPVIGFRAPSFSITSRSLWALDVLIDEGYTYDSSVFPIVRDRYGIPGSPRHAHVINRAGGSIWEVPPSTVRWAGVNMPVAGGGYFRLFPYLWTRLAIERLNSQERRPAVVYLHPWEIDPDQPRIEAGRLSQFRHYVNISRTEDRLARLLKDFAFAPLSEALVEYDADRFRDTVRVPFMGAPQSISPAI